MGGHRAAVPDSPVASRVGNQSGHRRAETRSEKGKWDSHERGAVQNPGRIVRRYCWGIASAPFAAQQDTGGSTTGLPPRASSHHHRSGGAGAAGPPPTYAQAKLRATRRCDPHRVVEHIPHHNQAPCGMRASHAPPSPELTACPGVGLVTSGFATMGASCHTDSEYHKLSAKLGGKCWWVYVLDRVPKFPQPARPGWCASPPGARSSSDQRPTPV